MAFTPSSQPEGSSPRNSAESLAESHGVPRAKLIKQFETDFRESHSWFAKWRRSAKRYYKTYAGDPWESGDRARLARTDRPAVNLNVSLATINAIVGADMLERREVRFAGEDSGYYDAAVGDWLTRIVRHQFNRTQGHRSDSQVLHDGLVTGLGYSRVYLDNRRWPFRLRVEHLHPWLVYPDPDASDTNLTDRRFLIYESTWTREQVVGRWGKEIAAAIRPASLSPDGMGGGASNPRQVVADNYRTKNDPLLYHDPEGRRLKIFEYEYLVHEPWVAFTDEGGRDQRMPAEEFEELGDQAADLEGVEYPQEVWRRAFIAAAISQEGALRVLEDKPLPIDVSPISCYSGFRWVDVDASRVRWFGLMHVIHEPQLLYARTLVNLVEYFARGAKGGAFVETEALEDPTQAKEDWAKPGAMILLKPGAIQQKKIHERKAITWPNSMDALMKLLREGITDISAVSEWLKGTATSERSNVLISNLQSQSMTVLAPALDPMSGFRMQQGLALAKMAVRYLSAPALDKILGEIVVPGITHREDPAQPGQPLREPDPATGMTGPSSPPIPLQGEDGQPVTPGKILREQVDLFDYEVQVDLGTASPTARQAFFQMMTQHGLLDKMIEMGLPPQEILPELLKVSPLPPEVSKPLADKLKAMLQAPTVEQVAQQLQRMSPEDRQQIVQMLTGGGEPAPPAPPRQQAA